MTTTTTSPSDTAAPTSPQGYALLEATDIQKAYRRGWWPRRRSLSVLRGAQVTVTAGEIVGLVGENGSAPPPSSCLG